MSSVYDGNKPLGASSGLQTRLTYSWINNEQFYQLVPSNYRFYYQRMVKQYFYWYDGYVPYFHNEKSGIFATRLAYTILNKLSKKIVNNKLLFNDDGVQGDYEIEVDGKSLNSYEFIEHLFKKDRLLNKLTQTVEWSMVGGDAIIKIDSADGELTSTPLRKDQYFYSTNFRNEIDEISMLIYTYHKMAKQDNQNAQNTYYYLLEERRFNEDNEPEYRMSIKMGTGVFGNTTNVDMEPETVPFERLPRDISHKFKRDFPNVMLGEWSKLPFKDSLGVFLFKNTEKVSFLPSLPFGESELSNLIHLLMTYDYYYTMVNTNLYTARDKVIMPQGIQPATGYGNQYANHLEGFDSYVITMQPYADPETQKPIALQFDLRDWKTTRDNILQSVAMSMGVSTRDIMSDAAPASEKPTAREIGSEEWQTTSFIETKQNMIKPIIDEMIRLFLEFYNFKNETVTVKFSKAGLTNLNNLTTIATVMKQNGLMSTKMALQMFHTDLDNKSIENEVNLIREEMELNANIKEHYKTANKVKGEEQYFNELEDVVELESDVEETLEQQNNNDPSHVKKPKE